MRTLLRKLFNYYPEARQQVFDIEWLEGERIDEAGKPWLTVEKAYRARRGWRILLNGRDIVYEGGLEKGVEEGDAVSIFPPGR